MKESDFTTEVINSLEYFGFYAYKIADMPNAARRVIKFTPVKPCDIIACSLFGVFYAIECKIIKKWQGMHKGMIRDSQINALDRIVDNDGRAYIFVNVRIEPNKSKGIKRENSCIVFDWRKHRDSLIEGLYNIDMMRSKSVGQWVTSSLTNEISQTSTKKRLWDFSGLW